MLAWAAAAALIASADFAQAQEAAAGSALRPLCPDRPGKATAACTVDKRHWQLEVDAADYTRQTTDGAVSSGWLVGAFLLKYGITDDLDLEASFAPFTRLDSRPAAGAPEQTWSGVGDLYLRAKLNLVGNGGGGFGLALEPYVKAPTAKDGIGNGAWEEGLLAPVSLNLPHGWSLSLTPEADVVLNGSGAGRHVAVQLPVGVSHAVGPISASVELWTSQDFDPAGTTRQYSLDLSGAWQPGSRPDLQLDAGVNLGLNQATPDVQVYVGVSHRF